MALTPEILSSQPAPMEPDTAITVKNLSEKYRMSFRLNGREQIREFWALKNINLNIKKGEILGIIGENGSGKTTLLKVLAGLLEPDCGTVEKQGTLSALIDIGAGLDQDFSGRENIFNALALTEPDKTKHKERAEEIIAFADLGQFIDASVKNYSTGMQLRLGFSILVHVSPDILVVDEVISVGDNEFQNKCQQKLADFVRNGRTVILVSHDIARLVPVCTRMILLKGGQIMADGNTQKVLDCYDQTSGSRNSVAVCQEGDLRVVFNSGRVFIRWKDETLTPFGAYSWASEFERFRESSRSLIWKATVPEAGKITAEGRSPTSGQEQKINISLNKDGRLSFDIQIKIDPERSGMLRKIERRCQLAPKSFARWFISGREDALGDGVPRDMIDRALSDTATDTKRPYLAVGPKDTDTGLFMLFNSNPDTQELNYEIIASEFDNLAVRAFGRGPDNDSTRCEHKETIQLFPDKTALLNEIESLSAGTVLNAADGCSVLSAHSAHLSLEHNGTELFRETGIVVSFFVPEHKRSYFSFQAQSKSVAVEGEGRVRKKLVWDGLADIEMYLSFSVKDKGYGLDIEVLNPGQKKIKDITVKFLFAALTKSISFCGELKALTVPKRTDSAPVLFRDCYGPGFGLETRNGSFFSARTQDKDVLWYFNTVCEMNKQDAAADCVAVANCAAKDKKISRSFDIRLSHEPGDTEQDTQQKPPAQISNSLLKLVFSSGTAQLFYKNKEISTGFGLYSSALIQDTPASARWADSRHGLWTVNEATETKISVSGLWPWADMEQTWVFEIKDDRTIGWTLDIKIEKHSPAVRALQAGLMLSDFFTNAVCESKDSVRCVHRDENLSWFELGTGKKVGFQKRSKSLFGSRPACPNIVFSIDPGSGSDFEGKAQKVKGLFNSKILVFETNRPSGLGSCRLNGCIQVWS